MAEIIPIKGIVAENKLITEEKPVIYYYQQQFNYKGEQISRSGFICGVKLEPYDKGIILPHQQILPDKSDEQMVLGLFNDFSFKLDKLVRQAAGTDTDVQFTDADGVTHSLTVINDDAIIQQVQQEMERQRIFIAGGHHSYDVALHSAKDNPEAKYIIMALMNLYDPNLIILPVHRLVKDVPDFNVDNFINQLKEDFVVEQFSVNPNGENMQEFLQAIYHRGGFDIGLGIEHHRTFGLYAGNGQGYLVTLESETTMDHLMPKEGYSLALQGLDVFVLHYTVLQRLLGLDKKNTTETTQNTADVKEGSITYTRKEDDALKKVDSDEYQLAFFLNPVVFDEFTAVAIGGELMPPESTYFYPPVPAGLMVMK